MGFHACTRVSRRRPENRVRMFFVGFHACARVSRPLDGRQTDSGKVGFHACARVSRGWAFTRVSFLLHPSPLDDLITTKSYTMSTSVLVRTAPALPFKVYALFSMRSPSFLMLIAAFWSLPMVNPQSHRIVRTVRFFISLWTAPHRWHI